VGHQLCLSFSWRCGTTALSVFQLTERDTNQPARDLHEFLLAAGGRWILGSDGTAASYGLDHGPLQAYAMCSVLHDPCMIHGELGMRGYASCSAHNV
jgi:hypothetical protein